MTPIVVLDPEILGGIPVFAGTRVPVAHVVADLRKGTDHTRIREAYPSLTDQHWWAALIVSGWIDEQQARAKKGLWPLIGAALLGSLLGSALALAMIGST